MKRVVVVKVLIIEDDMDIVVVLRANLSELEAECVHAVDGEKGVELALSEKFDLIILDVMLPKLGGIEVCKQIRQTNKNIPILMLTAKNEEIDKVVGLEVGADDYMIKPFSIREMVARVKALLRRAAQTADSSTAEPQIIEYGTFYLDPSMRIFKIDGEELELTAIEFELLLFLAQSPGKPFTREQLAYAVWQTNASNFEATVTSQLSRLRKRIEKDPVNPKFIHTVRGVGYRFARLEEL